MSSRSNAPAQGAGAQAAERGRGALSGPMLFQVFRCDAPRAPVARYDLASVARVEIGRGADQTQRDGYEPASSLRIAVSDWWMSPRQTRLERAGSTWTLYDEGGKKPTLLAGSAVTRARLTDGDLFESGGTFFIYRDMLHAGETGDRAIAPSVDVTLSSLVPELAIELARLDTFARGPLPLLLLGEGGVGKAGIAHALHLRSGRRGEFVIALPELDQTTVERSRGGTLYIDELGALLPDAQALLLAALRDGDATPGVAPRVIAASNGELDALRADLRARVVLNPFTLAPLRERREDLGMFISAALARIAPGQTGPRFTPPAARALFASPWPRNVRGLESALSSALGLAGAAPIAVEHLPSSLRAPPSRPAAPIAQATPLTPALMFRHDGEAWAVAWGSTSLRVHDSEGMRYLTHLVGRPGVEVLATDLVALVRGPEAVDTASPDEATKTAYRDHLRALKERLDEATAWGAVDEAARIRGEIHAIAEQLAGARSRRASEPPHASVEARLREAIATLAEGSETLGRHLATAVRAGPFCVYDPR